MATATKWVFKERGPTAKVVEAVKASSAPEELKAYVAWLVESCGYDGVALDFHAYKAGEDGIVEHAHVKRLY